MTTSTCSCASAPATTSGTSWPASPPTTLPGEVALNGFGARQLRQPGPVLLLAADLLSRAHLQDTTPDLADAVSFGLRLGGVCAPLLPQRWEQAWTMPLTQWREDLGIAEELRLSPFAPG